MIGLDTNVIVRYIMQDDLVQSRKATRLVEEKLSSETPGYITLVTLAEVIWVLKSVYEIASKDLINLVGMLLATKQIRTERASTVYRAVKVFDSGRADFSDALIVVVGMEDGCTEVVSFDKKAASIGMRVI
jgi:predicted nucleic-acid-binding protein